MSGPIIIRGWKAIARRLGVSVRAARDRERRCRLPIHRDGTVYVEQEELDDWLKEREHEPECGQDGATSGNVGQS